MRLSWLHRPWQYGGWDRHASSMATLDRFAEFSARCEGNSGPGIVLNRRGWRSVIRTVEELSIGVKGSEAGSVQREEARRRAVC